MPAAGLPERSREETLDGLEAAVGLPERSREETLDGLEATRGDKDIMAGSGESLEHCCSESSPSDKFGRKTGLCAVIILHRGEIRV
eukprot:CAMPEP_0114544300 /NCGR_PEP_ID=MMETSP0114-20121206/2803_1 /TAXON_ID=31324 /ORGANISM="Goniomonas sp, Strain m" /LENGTH=85 /DNA_ID=CAMNT_0001728671 /DNA_START=129 /DNA_END=386 /DNA_ORIENTATION=-